MKQHKNLAVIDFIVVAAMAVLSLMPLLGLNISGFGVILGLLYYFIQRRINGISTEESGMCFKCIPKALEKKAIWLWIALPLILDAGSLVLSRAIAPGYLNHVFQRSAGIISYNELSKLLIQVVMLALGEEIAYRAFFQGTLSRTMPAIPAIILTSVFFAMSHLSKGDPGVVLYDITFVFLDSIVYGIIYHKTNNGYISAISHIVSNLFGIILIMSAPH